MQEVLKQIKGFPDYQISNLGYVLSTKKYKNGTVINKMNPYKTKSNRELLILSNNGYRQTSYIHKLLAKYFN